MGAWHVLLLLQQDLHDPKIPRLRGGVFCGWGRGGSAVFDVCKRGDFSNKGGEGKTYGRAKPRLETVFGAVFRGSREGSSGNL